MLSLALLFVLTVLLIRIKFPIGFALLIGAIFLGIYHFGLKNEFWMMLYNSLKNLESWKLVLTVSLILTFANIYEDEGFVKSMVDSLKSFLPPSWVAITGPAIIGLLPMPGGAMVSAPLVKEIASGTDATPAELTAVNYWWRHVWETTWPLYPSIILAAAVLNVSVWNVAMINFPISIMCIITGLFLKKIGPRHIQSPHFNGLKLLLSLWPLIFIVLLGLIFKIDLILSVVFVILVVVLTQRIHINKIWNGIKRGFAFDIIALIFGVMTLMNAIETTGTAGHFYDELVILHIPSFLVVFVVPFVVGLLTGVTSAYIGVAFPVIMPMVGTADLTQSAGMLLAFAGGFMGVIASPVHLCLVLTQKYFGASFLRTLRLLAIPIIMTSVISWIVALYIYQ